MDDSVKKVVVYYCYNLKLFRNGAHKTIAAKRPGLSLVAIPCSGKMEAHHLLRTLAEGAQGILVLGCAEAACQYLEGSTRSRKRVGYARSWLEKLNIEPDRIRFVQIPPMDVEAFERTLADFYTLLDSFEALHPRKDEPAQTTRSSVQT